MKKAPLDASGASRHSTVIVLRLVVQQFDRLGGYRE